MKKKHVSTHLPDDPVTNAASLLGKRSVRARKRKWGEGEGYQNYLRKQREYGMLGGRPPKKNQEE